MLSLQVVPGQDRRVYQSGWSVERLKSSGYGYYCVQDRGCETVESMYG